MAEATRAPLALWLYGAFCLVVSVVDIGVLVSRMKDVRELLTLYTTWSPSLPYLFSLVFVGQLLCGRRRDLRLLWGLIAILGIYVLFGLWGVVIRLGVETSNPYLQVTPFQIVWVALVPLFWMLVLRSRRMAEWASGVQEAEAGAARSS